MKFIAAIALTLLAATTAAAAPAQTLRIGTDGAYPPYNSTTPAGVLVGFEIDLVKDLCRRMNRQCEFVTVDWNGMIPKLQEGTVDVIMSGLSIRPERRKVIDFSLPYFAAPTYFVVRKGGKLSVLQSSRVIDLAHPTADDRKALADFATQMKNATIGVEGSTTHEDYVKHYFPEAKRVRVYPKQESLFLDAAIGRVDAVCVGYSNILLFIRKQKAQGKEFVAIGPGVRGGVLGEGVAFGLRKQDDALEAQLNQALRAAQSAGTIARLSRHWFGIDGSVAYEAPSAVAAR